MLVLNKASTCDVCMEEYSTGENSPHSISCGHVFCQKCLDHLLRHICPLCRAQFSPREIRRLHIDLQSESPTVTTADDSSGRPRIGPYGVVILLLAFIGSIFFIREILPHYRHTYSVGYCTTLYSSAHLCQPCKEPTMTECFAVAWQALVDITRNQHDC